MWRGHFVQSCPASEDCCTTLLDFFRATVCQFWGRRLTRTNQGLETSPQRKDRNCWTCSENEAVSACYIYYSKQFGNKLFSEHFSVPPSKIFAPISQTASRKNQEPTQGLLRILPCLSTPKNSRRDGGLTRKSILAAALSPIFDESRRGVPRGVDGSHRVRPTGSRVCLAPWNRSGSMLWLQLGEEPSHDALAILEGTWRHPGRATRSGRQPSSTALAVWMPDGLVVMPPLSPARKGLLWLHSHKDREVMMAWLFIRAVVGRPASSRC
ncbi:hypothetical protein JRQ81_008947 [Phrynocephalus forsythii]|uniref:Uncharacterized protein n=1 Tax=Phrynocephalus forsythii TaxID=171643 RepID=A0A9Q0XEC4_9SAUR|nr:hypothetical protein JRQ81_008947 [Phrynocephalus forsythii]